MSETGIEWGEDGLAKSSLYVPDVKQGKTSKGVPIPNLLRIVGWEPGPPSQISGQVVYEGGVASGVELGAETHDPTLGYLIIETPWGARGRVRIERLYE